MALTVTYPPPSLPNSESSPWLRSTGPVHSVSKKLIIFLLKLSTYSTSHNAMNASLKISVNIKKWINIDSLRGGNSRECQIKGAIISYIHDHYHYYHHHHLHHRHWHHWQLCCENLGSVWGVAIPASECAPTVLHRIIGSCVLRTVQSMSIVQYCTGLLGVQPGCRGLY